MSEDQEYFQESTGEEWKAGGVSSNGVDVAGTLPPNRRLESIKIAKRLNDGTKLDIDQFPGRQEIYELHSKRIDWFENLIDPEQRKRVFAELKTEFPDRFHHINVDNIGQKELVEASKFTHQELDRATEALNKARNGINAPSILPPSSQLDDIKEKGPNLVSRKFFGTANKINDYLNDKTTGQKLFIAGVSTVVGGILLNSGGKWLSQGIEGREPHYARMEDGSVLAVTKPMNPSKRVAQVLGGVVAGVTGVAAEIFGFVALYKTFLSH